MRNTYTYWLTSHVKGTENMIKVKCHCGLVELNMGYLPEQVTQCNCSICRRLAARWLYYKKAEVTITKTKQQMKAYQWGDKMLNFYHCNNCGFTTHYATTTESGIDRIAINANMMDISITEGLSIRYFNGEDM